MPINFRSYSEIISSIRSDIVRFLPTLDPTIFGNFSRAFADSLAGRAYDISLVVQQLVKEMFPSTASAAFLERWATYERLSRTAATAATGQITFTGTAASVIPDNTSLQTSAGILYTTQAELTLSAQVISVTSLVRVGSLVTATTSSDHLLGSGQSVTIAGAVETDYNGSFQVTVLSATTFTYTITATPSTPATGTITASFNGGSVAVESDDTGQDQNLESGAQLNLVSPISGVDTTARVQFSEVGGGADDETDANLLTRTLNSRSNPTANFNVGAIEKAVLSVAGVTRVNVKRITPYPGAVTVQFVRDDDANIIPSASEVTTVRDVLLEILPAHSDPDDLIVIAPTAVTTGFTFSSITPDTSTMRTAIENNLIAFFRDDADFETTILADRYRAAIVETTDPGNGDILTDFTLTTPLADIIISTDEIGVLGSVIF